MKIGFIGIGIMGRPMAKNLLKAGYDLVVYDKVAKLDDVVAAGAKAGASNKDVASQCEVVITMLPNSPHVKEAGARGERRARRGEAGDHPRRYELDRPRRGAGDLQGGGGQGRDHARRARFPAASRRRSTAPSRSWSAAMPRRSTRSSRSSKRWGPRWCAWANPARATSPSSPTRSSSRSTSPRCPRRWSSPPRRGVDPEAVFDAIKGGLAGSTVMNAKVPMMLARNFAPGFRIELHVKDLQNALDTAHALHVAVPLTASVMETMQAVTLDGPFHFRPQRPRPLLREAGAGRGAQVAGMTASPRPGGSPHTGRQSCD